MDIRQTEEYAQYLRSIGWIIEKTSFGNVFVRKLWFFSVIKIQRVENINWDELKQIAKKYHALFINLEPSYQLKAKSYQLGGMNLLPTKTVVLDLEHIDLPKDTKYEIRKARESNPPVEQSTDIESFYKILQETMKIGGWQIPIKNEVTKLYQAFLPQNGAILSNNLSGCLLIWSKDTAHFMYAANTKDGRKNGGAYLVLWEAITFCQARGIKYLDLEGIYDARFPNQNKSWIGFSKFKMGWGGEAKEYPKSTLIPGITF